METVVRGSLEDDTRLKRFITLLWNPLFWLFFLITIYRLYFVFQPPLRSTDLLRNIGFGKEFWRYGLGIYDHPAQDFVGTTYATLGPERYYAYPVVALLFFALVAKIWPSLIFGKLVLTALEGLNAFLVWKISKDRLLPLLYFANPVSLWWVSREGQFEPLMISFALLALYLLPRHSPGAYFSLALGVQSKLTPVFLLPYLLSKRAGWREFFSFSLGFFPSLIFSLNNGYPSRFVERRLEAHVCNAYAWNIFDPSLLCDSPAMLVATNALVTYGILFLCLFLMVRRRGFVEYVGLLVFIVVLKSLGVGRPWYLLAVPLMAMPISERWDRRLFFVLGALDRVAIRRLLGIPSEFAYLRPKLMDAMWGF